MGTAAGEILAAVMAFLAIWLILALIIWVISSLIMMTVYKKAGSENAWFAWIPVLRDMECSKVATGKYTLGLVNLGICIISNIASFIVSAMGSDDISDVMAILLVFVGLIAVVAYTVINVYLQYQVAKKFGYGAWFILLSIFFSAIGWLVLAASNAKKGDDVSAENSREHRNDQDW